LRSKIRSATWKTGDSTSSVSIAIAQRPDVVICRAAARSTVTVNHGVANFPILALPIAGELHAPRASDASPALTSDPSNLFCHQFRTAPPSSWSPSSHRRRANRGAAPSARKPVVKEEDAFGNVITTRQHLDGDGGTAASHGTAGLQGSTFSVNDGQRRRHFSAGLFYGRGGKR